MSRDIGFRGKIADNGQWMYGYLRFVYIDTDKASIYDPISVSNYDVLLETVGQYIGIKDKNEKEIYEGDVVKIDGFDDEEDERFLVKFKNESARYTLSSNRLVYDFDNILRNECEVLGNKYENPELLVGEV